MDVEHAEGFSRAGIRSAPLWSAASRVGVLITTSSGFKIDMTKDLRACQAMRRTGANENRHLAQRPWRGIVVAGTSLLGCSMGKHYSKGVLVLTGSSSSIHCLKFRPALRLFEQQVPAGGQHDVLFARKDFFP